MSYSRTYKPVADRLLALVLIVLLSPLLILLTVLGFLSFGKPFFAQERAGYRGIPFLMLKYRSMTDAAHLPDEQRLTRYGKLIRRFSLDELPQLFNVLAGSMSLVGPRPLPVSYMGHMTPEERTRFGVLPGLTGLTQVSGRNLLSWKRKFELDARYAASVSLRHDADILMKTLPTMIKGAGISHPGYATMPVFDRPGKEGQS